MSETLEKVFDFDETDLALNQSGQLSEGHIKRLSKYRRISKNGTKLAFGAMFITSVFWFAMWLWGIGLKFDSEQHIEITLAFFVALSIIWLLFLFFVWLGKARSDLKSGKISSVEGFAELKHKKLPRSLGTAYYVTIGNVRFQVETKEKYEAIKSDEQYRFFYIKHPPTHIILSAAKI